MTEIVSISIYSNNQRVVLSPDSQGKFLIPNMRGNSISKPLLKVTAVGLVTHFKIKNMDPVLKLSDGSKMRVYQGGDSSGLITMAISLCEKHDNKHRKKITPKRKRRKIIAVVDDLNRDSIEDYVEDCFNYPWSDPNLYDDSD